MSKQRTSRTELQRLPIPVICRRLRNVYGPVERPSLLPPLDELIATVLSQNTSDRNSHAAFDALRRRFPDWETVRKARIQTIVRTIKSGGLAQQKAPRIKAILEEIQRRHGRLSLDFLRTMPSGEALRYLLSFDGVGRKTAACVLLFSCQKPVLPVDTHVHRLSRRLGLIDEKTTAEKAHDKLADLVPSRLVLEFHIQFIRHGRTVCSARNPACNGCVLLEGCQEGQQSLRP